jgi:hypothetical protein
MATSAAPTVDYPVAHPGAVLDKAAASSIISPASSSVEDPGAMDGRQVLEAFASAAVQETTGMRDRATLMAQVDDAVYAGVTPSDFSSKFLAQTGAICVRGDCGD